MAATAQPAGSSRTEPFFCKWGELHANESAMTAGQVANATQFDRGRHEPYSSTQSKAKGKKFSQVQECSCSFAAAQQTLPVILRTQPAASCARASCVESDKCRRVGRSSASSADRVEGCRHALTSDSLMKSTALHSIFRLIAGSARSAIMMLGPPRAARGRAGPCGPSFFCKS